MKNVFYEKVTRTPEETAALAKKLGAVTETGIVLCLVGDLGVGKTLFVQGFSRGLGVTEDVTSPTFALMNQYHGRMPVTHFDLYRLEREEELDDIGFYEYSDPLNGVIMIEWADKFPDAMPEPNIWLEIKRGVEDTERKLKFFTTEEGNTLWRELTKK